MLLPNDEFLIVAFQNLIYKKEWVTMRKKLFDPVNAIAVHDGVRISKQREKVKRMENGKCTVKNWERKINSAFAINGVARHVP